jgi:hypothetical protein
LCAASSSKKVNSNGIYQKPKNNNDMDPNNPIFNGMISFFVLVLIIPSVLIYIRCNYFSLKTKEHV